MDEEYPLFVYGGVGPKYEAFRFRLSGGETPLIGYLPLIIKLHLPTFKAREDAYDFVRSFSGETMDLARELEEMVGLSGTGSSR